MQDTHLFVGGDYVDTSRMNHGAVFNLNHLHGGSALEELHHEIFLRRFQMLDDDKGDAGVRRNIAQKQVESLEPARRSTDSDNWTGSVDAPLGAVRWQRSVSLGLALFSLFFHHREWSRVNHI